jgi:large subunit ribosomal protein L25
MQHLVLKAIKREPKGRKPARRLRAKDLVPAIIYGHGDEPEAIALPGHDLRLELAHGAHLLDVELDGKQARYLIKDVQYGHLGVNLLHVDLARVRLDQRVTVSVPLDFRGTPKGGQTAGARFDHDLVDLEIECLVTEIPESIRVQVSDLELGQSIHARDVELPPGVKLKTDPDAVVCAVRARLVAEEAAEEAPPEAAEPEVIARGKEEEAAKAEPERKEPSKEKES